MTLVDDRAGSRLRDGRSHDGRAAGRPVRARAGRAHLPDLGADLRLQPGLRALPVQLGPARPGRAHHRRVQGAHRRVRAHADLLREHRRRRAHRAGRLLGAGGLRHRPPCRRQVLDQRVADHRRGGRAPGRQRLHRRADLARRRHRRGQRRRPRRRIVRHRGHRHGTTGRRRLRRLQALGGGHPPQRQPARCVQGAGRPLRGPAPADPPATVGPGRRRVGRAPSHRRATADPLRLAGGPRRGRAHRRLVLPPGRLRRVAARAQPLRRGPGGVPGGPGGRRLRLPLRHPRRVPGRQRALARRVRRRVAPLRSLRRAAPTPERGRVRFVRPLRRLPGRVHGGQVLHRPPARRARPRMRPRPRRALAGRPRRGPTASPDTRPLASGRGGPRSPSCPAAPTGPATRARSPPSILAPPPAEPWPGLVEPVAVAGRTAPSRVVFGPHETNLGRGRSFSDRHVAYYEARAAGGAGIVVTETASVHPSDWPYERAPLAESCGPGWSAVAEGLSPPRHPGAGRAGPLRRPGVERLLPVGDVGPVAGWPTWSAARCRWTWSSPTSMSWWPASPTPPGGRWRRASTGWRSTPATARSSASSTPGSPTCGPTATGRIACASPPRCSTPCGPPSGPTACWSLRLCCDELAPWAGVTPDQARDQVAALADLVDLIVVVRGGPFSASAYRPDAHTAGRLQPRAVPRRCARRRRAGPPSSCRAASSTRRWPSPPWTTGWPTWSR